MRERKSTSAASPKPMSGEMTSESPISRTLIQFTPSPNTWFGRSELARPTPTMAPMSVCELEAGNPKYQVPRFHKMAPRSSARTMASPAPLPPDESSSTGKSLRMPIATAMPPVSTPSRLKSPLHMTA